ncbi:hypothetical protein HHI36_000315 [Cryptolaemus montrouzieri]|uniref:WD repeat-containing protein 74 n=1 Tax=Cryptolaemus montrouzieri TaxID=559131 RepID=A0ABD2P4Z8_9CUCU
MELSNKYGIYIGTSRGTISYTNLDPKEKLHYEFAKEASEMSSMVWGRGESEILTGFKNGNICIYDTNQQKYSRTIDKLKNQGSIVGVGYIDDKLYAASSKGNISILNLDEELETIKTLSLENSTLDSCAQNMNKLSILATGGENNDLKLWDLEKQQCIFKAKSLGHDQLNLPIKASIRGITFIPEEQNVCSCVTKEGHILLYDDRVQRKPVCKYFDQKASFTTVTTAYRQRNILAGTTKGYVQYMDMKTGKSLKTFTGIGGSVTCILTNAMEPLVAVSSLDRYLRIFNLDNKEICYKQYMKQSLTRMVMKPIIKEESEEIDENLININEDQEYEEIFKNMEEVTEKPHRKRNSIGIVKTKTKKLKNKGISPSIFTGLSTCYPIKYITTKNK